MASHRFGIGVAARYLLAFAILTYLYLPLFAVGLASFSKKRYFSFPIQAYSSKWHESALESSTISELMFASTVIAVIVAAISVMLGFFGALAFARCRWKGRGLFQKFILLPVFFPQTVLGLALLLWFNALGVVPDWKTAVVAHLVWVAPIATLIIAIQAYSLDPALENAAMDLGATSWQALTKITLPLLAPGIFSGGLFAFLLSWGNFPLSLFTTGADSTLPEWLYAKMVSGYSPLVPAIGALLAAGAIATIFLFYIAARNLRRNDSGFYT